MSLFCYALKFCNHLEEEEKAGCSDIIVLQMYCYKNIMRPCLTVPWVGLQCMIVVFPDHTHLRFEKRCLYWCLIWLSDCKIDISSCLKQY